MFHSKPYIAEGMTGRQSIIKLHYFGLVTLVLLPAVLRALPHYLTFCYSVHFVMYALMKGS
jgi:hypothetical protein